MFKILLYTYFNWTCLCMRYVSIQQAIRCQYVRFHILAVHLYFGLFFSGIPTMCAAIFVPGISVFVARWPSLRGIMSLIIACLIETFVANTYHIREQCVPQVIMLISVIIADNREQETPLSHGYH